MLQFESFQSRLHAHPSNQQLFELTFATKRVALTCPRSRFFGCLGAVDLSSSARQKPLALGRAEEGPSCSLT